MRKHIGKLKKREGWFVYIRSKRREGTARRGRGAYSHLLLGGVPAASAGPFTKKSIAEDFKRQAVEVNRAAGRVITSATVRRQLTSRRFVL